MPRCHLPGTVYDVTGVDFRTQDAKSMKYLQCDFAGLSPIRERYGRGPWPEISKKSNTWYAKLCNRWVAALGIFIKLAIMFLVQWAYALASIFLLVFLWFCIGRTKPGAFPGVTEFKLFPWLRNLFLRCIGKKPTDYEQIVVAPACPGVSTMESQLNDENVDYASRHRYHHSTTLQTSSHFQQHCDDSE